jgi:hypothetical protein
MDARKRHTQNKYGLRVQHVIIGKHAKVDNVSEHFYLKLRLEFYFSMLIYYFLSFYSLSFNIFFFTCRHHGVN